jgi:beta-lactam-binding protein with PASTA domain
MSEAMHRAATADLVVVGRDGRISSQAPGQIVAQQPRPGATTHPHGEVAVWMTHAADPTEPRQSRSENTTNKPRAGS